MADAARTIGLNMKTFQYLETKLFTFAYRHSKGYEFNLPKILTYKIPIKTIKSPTRMLIEKGLRRLKYYLKQECSRNNFEIKV